MKNTRIFLTLLFLVLFLLQPLHAAAAAPVALVMTIDGAITQATQEYMVRGIQTAEQEQEAVKESALLKEEVGEDEIARIVAERYDFVLVKLRGKRGLLDAIAEKLLELETLDQGEFALLLGGGTLPLPTPTENQEKKD